MRAKESLIISVQHDLASWKEVNSWAKIIFAVKLRNPYFHHIWQIGRQNNSPQKVTHWLGPGFLIGLNENGTNFKEIQENILLVMSTLILWLTHIEFGYFKHNFKGVINALKKTKKVLPTGWLIYNNQDYWWDYQNLFGCQHITEKKGSIVFCDLHTFFHGILWLIHIILKILMLE